MISLLDLISPADAQQNDCSMVDGNVAGAVKHLDSIFSSLALGVIEVGWHSDNGIIHLSAKVGLSCLLHFGEDH